MFRQLIVYFRKEMDIYVKSKKLNEISTFIANAIDSGASASLRTADY